MNNSTYGQSFHKIELELAHLAFPFLLIFYVVILTKLFTKYKNNFGPVHVLELNIVMDLIVWAFASSFLLGYFEQFFQGISVFCVMVNFLEYTIRVSLNLDLIASQMERFLAIYLNMSYHDIVTTNKSIQTIISIKIVSTLITVIFAFFNPHILQCTTSEELQFPPVCTLLKDENVYMSTIPLSILYIVIVVVTIYVATTVYKLQNAVTPLVSLPTIPQQNIDPITQEYNQANDDSQQNQQPSTYTMQELPLPSISTIEQEYEKVRPTNKTRDMDERQETTFQGENPSPSTSHGLSSETNDLPGQTEDVVLETKVFRVNSNPNMFYKTQVATITQCQCLPALKTQKIQIAKKILNVNIQTMVVLILFLPMNIFYVHAYFTRVRCYSNPEIIPYLKSAGFLQFGLFSMLYTIIVQKKLQNAQA